METSTPTALGYNHDSSAAAPAKHFPPQIKYIVGNEACERFSYYGMKCILVLFMVKYLKMQENIAGATYHEFSTACYLLPLLGAWLSDRYLGKYKTIMLLSMVYCLGHLALSLWDNSFGLYAGLALIALGSGGIKPCVSAHVGDQFNEKTAHLLPKIFEVFYFSINFGAFFSTLAMPWTLDKYGPGLAFGIPGILMAIATFVFWLGRHQYVHVPPTGKTGATGFMTVMYYSLTHLKDRKSGETIFDVAKAKYKHADVEAAKSAASIFKVFGAVSIFWALFDQTGSSWVLQADKMDKMVFGYELNAAQIGAVNPIMVMLLIPFFSFVVYPLVEKIGIKVTPLRKMSAGMALAALSFVMVAMFQTIIDGGGTLSIGWQILPYFVITCSEVLVSITGLEFAYTQAPRSMKSTIMSFWLLTVAVGNQLVAIIMGSGLFAKQDASFFYSFAGMMFGLAMVFIFLASRYRLSNYVESAAQPVTHPA